MERSWRPGSRALGRRCRIDSATRAARRRLTQTHLRGRQVWAVDHEVTRSQCRCSQQLAACHCRAGDVGKACNNVLDGTTVANCDVPNPRTCRDRVDASWSSVECASSGSELCNLRRRDPEFVERIRGQRRRSERQQRCWQLLELCAGRDELEHSRHRRVAHERRSERGRSERGRDWWRRQRERRSRRQGGEYG
jgi:hypothetical protein